MDSNTHSTQPPGPPPAGHPDDLAELTAALDRLAARDLDRLSDGVRAERVLALRAAGWTGWTASGSKNWPGSTPAAPPGPKTATRWARPPAGCGTGCA